MQNVNMPLVSIGVPVYNGEKTLSEALSSLLAQDYKNLEIIISDNGSTDDTPKICKEFANKDKRVTYYRSDENLGSSWNFNRVFDLSNGKYFMWAAHDDFRKKPFVSECVKQMESSPSAALCQTHTTTYIVGHKEIICVANLDSFKKDSGLVERYRETLKHFPATAIYGLYRSSLMKKTRMFEKVIATDLAFTQELSIYGSFIQVPEAYFDYNIREKWNTIHQDYKLFLGKERKPFWYLPFIVLFINHWSRIVSASIPLYVKLLLLLVLVEHQVKYILLKILIKFSGRLCPSRWREKLGTAIYWRWMHIPNLEVRNTVLFHKRVIKPTLGWWR